MTGVLELDCVSVGYPSGRRKPPFIVLETVSARTQPGEMIGLVGPNGVGKSTLLRSIARLQPMFCGKVRLDGVSLETLSRKELAQRMAMVLTDRFDVDHLRVRAVVELGRHPHLGPTRRITDLDHELVDQALSDVGAAHLSGRLVSSLSDGQRQRVLIARALAQAPHVLLLDEPTSFLDPPGRISIMKLLRDVAQQRGTTVVVCTHELELAGRYCDQLWVSSPSKHLHTGSPEELALAGHIAEPFATPGVVFRLDDMTFSECEEQWQKVRIEASPGVAAAVAQCLRRQGFSPSDDAAVTFTVREDDTGFVVCHDDASVRCASLPDVVGALLNGGRPELVTAPTA